MAITQHYSTVITSIYISKPTLNAIVNDVGDDQMERQASIDWRRQQMTKGKTRC